ncbi:hypothetical protein V3C99_004739, partial [Haemonchus contortus]
AIKGGVSSQMGKLEKTQQQSTITASTVDTVEGERVNETRAGKRARSGIAKTQATIERSVEVEVPVKPPPTMPSPTTPSPIMPSPTMSSPRPGPGPQAKPTAKSPKKPAVRKRLSSTPMREKSLIALATKVRQRKEPKPSTRRKSVDEDPFPRAAAAPKRGRKKKGKSKEEIFVPQIDSAFLLPETCGDIVGVVKPMEVDVRPTDNILPRSGLPVIKGNKDNDGMLLTNGQPFWFTDMPPDETDDELVMNASVLIEVMENRRKLVPMPDIEIVLDPMEETTVLAARDKSCYTRDVLFGNTVRSMVNLNELSIRALSIKGRKKAVAPVEPDELRSLAMEVPTVLHLYYRKTYDQFSRIPFVPTPKKPPLSGC